MDIRSLSGLNTAQNQQNLQKATAKLQDAVNRLVTGTKNNRASDDVAAIALSTQRQSQITQLRQTSSTLAQASSVAQVADDGLDRIQNDLVQLKSLAAQAASPVINDADRKALNEQFKQLKADIDRVANNTSFGGKKLLNGDLSGDKALSLDSLLQTESSGDGKLSIDKISAQELFKGKDINLASPANSTAALNAIGDALNQIISVRASVGSFQKAADFAAASIDSALQNQEAANSLFSDADFDGNSTDSILAQIQSKTAIAIAAQGNNKIAPLLNKLIG